MRAYVDLLSNRPFALLWASFAVSTFGDWFLQAAVYLVIYRLTGSPVHVALLGTLRALVSMLVGVLAGVAADRWDRRTLMLASDVARFLAFSAMTISPSVGSIYALMLLASCFDGLYRPAASAIVPSLVPRAKVVVANSLFGSTRNLMMFVAPALAGLFIAGWGPVAAFGVNALSFLLSGCLLWLVRSGPAVRLQRPPFWADLIGGLEYARHSRLLAHLLLASLVAGAGAAVADSMEVVYVEDFLRAPSYAYGMVLSAAGAGALLGALVVVRVAGSVPRQALFGRGLLATGSSMLLYPLIGSLRVLLIVVFCQGVFISVYQISRQTLLQERVTPSHLGRVFGLMGALGGVTYTVSKGFSGFLAQLVGVANLLALAGAFMALGGLIYLRLWPSSDEPAVDA